MKLSSLVLFLVLVAAPSTTFGRDIYVSAETGNEENDGSKEKPKKLLWKVMKDMKPGDHVFVAEGRYEGQAHAPTLPQVTCGDFTLEGGWAKDFSARDPFKHISEIGPPREEGNGTGGKVIHVESPDNKISNVTIDGFFIDRGNSNHYFGEGDPGAGKKIEGFHDNSPWGYQALNRKKSGTDPSVTLIGQGHFTVRNMVIVNSPWWGIYVKCGGDKPTTIENNLVLISQGRAIEALAGGGWGKPTIHLKNNTIAFNYAFGAGEGRAITADPKPDAAKYVVENNVLAFSDGGAIDTKFGAKGDSMTLTNNLFFFNLKGDMAVANAGGVAAKEFADQLECKSKDNASELPKFVAKLAKEWLDKWSYREGAPLVGTKFSTQDDLWAVRAAVGLPKETTIPGYDKQFPDYKSLPQKRNNYEQGRYPTPKKKGEGIDWEKDILPILGADGARGVQATPAGSK
ncbi:MAG: hypothetical protein ACAI25_13665 [Planctomycetota bacterium]